MTKESKSENESIEKNKSGSFILRHKMVFTLVIIILVISLWSIIKISLMEHRFKKETLKLKSDYENRIDSLTTKQIMLSSRVFLWAIRSELTRENKEQVNQFFVSFIKEPGVRKVEFVNAPDSKVLISTDKKDEGTVYTNQIVLMTNEAINFKNDSILTVVTPVMGLNNKLGALVIEYNLNKNH